MLFNSFNFLAFFVVVSAVYYASPHRFRWVVLLVASYYFYSTFSLEYLLLLGFATTVAYLAGIAIDQTPGGRQARAWLTVGLVAELSVLFVFKYFDFFAATIGDLLGASTEGKPPPLRLGLPLPVGLSFFTFSCMSYLVDVFRGTTKAERHPAKLAVYIAFFPKLLAGPIERAPAFLAQLSTPIRFDPAGVLVGLQLILWGLFKKVVIADRLAVFVDKGFTNPDFQSPVAVLIAVYFYAFQIYCDFSGYSDIAIGAALVLGIRLMENFRRPYLARSVAEFWTNRWHLSLARWFRDYLYIPLGGNRVGTARRFVNVLIVFLVSGLWHGANWTFVIWGGLNGLYQVIQLATAAPRHWLAARWRLPAALSGFLSILLTFHLVGLSWVFFRADSLGTAFSVLSRIVGAIPQFPKLIAAYHPTTEFYLSVGLILLLMSVEALDEVRPISSRLIKAPLALRWGAYLAVMFSVLIIGRWGTTGFVYMKF